MLSDFVEYRLSQLEGDYKYGVEEPYNVYGSRGFVDFYVLQLTGGSKIWALEGKIREKQNEFEEGLLTREGAVRLIADEMGISLVLKLEIYEIKASIEEFDDVGSIVRQAKKYLEYFTKKFPDKMETGLFLVLPPDMEMVKKIRDTLPLFKQMQELTFMIFSQEAYKESVDYCPLSFPLTSLNVPELREHPDYAGMDDKEFFYNWIAEGVDALEDRNKDGGDRYFEYLKKSKRIVKEEEEKNLTEEENKIKRAKEEGKCPKCFGHVQTEEKRGFFGPKTIFVCQGCGTKYRSLEDAWKYYRLFPND